MHRRTLLGATAATLAGLAPAVVRAQGSGPQGGTAGVKVAFLATLSGPGAALGTHMRDGWLTAMAQLGNTLGGLPAETLMIDDELKPETAVTKARAAIERDKVDFVVGLVFSNILGAVARPVTESGTFLLSANAGPSPLAGKGCNPFFFATSYQNDQNHATMGQVAQEEGYKRVFVLVPNYQAGKDAVAGFRSRFKGEIVDELYVPLSQLDFAAELAKIADAKPDALFTFMPGALGVNLVRQYHQAGLGRIPVLSTFTVDESTLPAQGDAALGFFTASDWAPNLPGERNTQFVKAFEAAHNYVPASYAAHAYDTAFLLDAAIKARGGKLGDKPALRAAIETVSFPSVRPSFKFGKNHFPVQDFYLCKVAKRPDGKFQTEIVRKVLTDDVDAYAAECRMPA